MTETFYPSEMKYDRAKAAVANYERESGNYPDKAEYKLVAEGLAQKLKEDDLVKFVYEGLGGAPVLSGAPAKEAKQRSVEAKGRMAKKRDAMLRREKINVK